MSILIKDAKAPKDCATCKMPMELCALWVGTKPGIKHPDCPIVELPREHGRLIDADAVKAKQQEDADLFINSNSLTDKIRRDEALNAVANIVNATTIIEAEEGET